MFYYREVCFAILPIKIEYITILLVRFNYIMSPFTKRSNKMDSITSMLQHTNINNLSNKAIIYARCSTKKQNEDMNQSLDTQIGICIDYCNRNNMEIHDIVKEVVSGHDYMKQSYYSILDRVSNTNIIIADPSRLSRNVGAADVFIKKCNELNILIHSVRDSIISDSHINCKKLLNLVYDAFIESSTISKRVSSALKIRKQMGSHLGKPPYGYTIEHVKDVNTGMKLRKLKENKKEQSIIQLMNLLYYGCNIQTLMKHCLYKKIINCEEINQFDGVIYYGNLWTCDIAKILNKHMIEGRHSNWTSLTVMKIVKKNIYCKKMLL